MKEWKGRMEGMEWNGWMDGWRKEGMEWMEWIMEWVNHARQSGYGVAPMDSARRN